MYTQREDCHATPAATQILRFSLGLLTKDFSWRYAASRCVPGVSNKPKNGSTYASQNLLWKWSL